MNSQRLRPAREVPLGRAPGGAAARQAPAFSAMRGADPGAKRASSIPTAPPAAPLWNGHAQRQARNQAPMPGLRRAILRSRANARSICARCGAEVDLQRLAKRRARAEGPAADEPAAKREAAAAPPVPPSGRRADAAAMVGRAVGGARRGRALAQGGRAAGVPAVRLRRRRQDDAGAPRRRGGAAARRPSPPSPARRRW